MMSHPPIVLVIAGNDPTGGAGIAADIQTLAQCDCHAAPVITCVTVQNTHNVLEKNPLAGEWIYAQAQAVLMDMPITVCKIGLLGSLEIVKAVHRIVQQFPHLQLVLDPVLSAGGGNNLSNQAIIEAIKTYLLPYTYLLTPNSQEARRLSGLSEGTLQETAISLLNMGCQHVCITGTHEETVDVSNTLYSKNKLPLTWKWSRLPDCYHGSGCTFASSAAAGLAKGLYISDAVYAAQMYTWNSLYQGMKVSTGQALPLRVGKLAFSDENNLF